MRRVLHSYVLYDETTKTMVSDPLSKTIVLYPSIELALVAANKSVVPVSVKPAITKVTIQL